jgi:hypothetical protein
MIAIRDRARPSDFRWTSLGHLIWFSSKALSVLHWHVRDRRIVASSTDSDLEAFSHNPADDSFAPLPDRTGANTNYLNGQFLSYYAQLLLRRLLHQ